MKFISIIYFSYKNDNNYESDDKLARKYQLQIEVFNGILHCLYYSNNHIHHQLFVCETFKLDDNFMDLEHFDDNRYFIKMFNHKNLR